MRRLVGGGSSSATRRLGGSATRRLGDSATRRLGGLEKEQAEADGGGDGLGARSGVELFIQEL